MLNIEQYEYMNGPHDGAGVKVLLHDPRQTPLVRSLGQAVPTGSSAFIGIRLLMVEYLTPPYGDCGTKPLHRTGVYTADECYLDCLTTMMTEKCDCRDIHMTSNGTSFPPACSLEQYFACTKGVENEFYEVFEDKCDCPVLRKVTLFESTLSHSSLSGHAVDSLLMSKSVSLYRKLLESSDVKARMDNRKHEEFRPLFETLDEEYTCLNALFRIIADYIGNQTEILQHTFFKNDFPCAVSDRMKIYDYQIYVLTWGIFFGKNAAANYLFESSYKFQHLFIHRIERLHNNSDTWSPNQIIDDLELRTCFIGAAVLWDSFTHGSINYFWFDDSENTVIDYFVPKFELWYAVHRSSMSSVSYCKDEIFTLYSNTTKLVDNLI